MTNKVKGEVSFKIQEKEYVLNYTHGALIKLENVLDKGIVKIMKEVQGWGTDPESIRIGTAIAILWAGLQRHHPEVTMDDAEQLMIRGGGLVAVLEKLSEALLAAFGNPDEGIRQTANPSTEAAAQTNGSGTVSSSTTYHSDTTLNPSGDSVLASTRS